MNTETRYNIPYFTADPRNSLPIALVDECEDPGSCYPSDDGEADLVDPGPTPVAGSDEGGEAGSTLPQLLDDFVAARDALYRVFRGGASLMGSPA